MINMIYQVVRWLVGGLFIFSGLIKVNDPVGMAIKLEEYFEVFGTHFMVPFALYLSVFVVVLEVALGVALILGYRLKLTLWALLGLIVFFTGLTFYSAWFNKVTDCGCFGDAIKLTPWQSFSKDVVLLVLILILMAGQKSLKPLAKDKVVAYGTIAATLFSLVLALYCINYLPIIDFRAYKTGNNIGALMQPSEPYKYRYLMKRGSEDKYFDQYPTDTTWQYVNMELMNPEAKPKITDYNLWNEEGEGTQASFEGVKLLIILQNIEKAPEKAVKGFADLARSLEGTKGLEAWVVTSAGLESFKSYRHELQLAFPYYFADATVLKTMIRSNPGLILLQNATVKGQWHYNSTPDKEEILKLIQ
jgi:uncharacterized membrane protein YphA (DoxX/SURF4 family)